MIPEYEALLEAVYRTILRPGDTAVDIGAHSGKHTLPMAECVGPTGVVHAFEPLPTIRGYLETVTKNWGLPPERFLLKGLLAGSTMKGRRSNIL